MSKIFISHCSADNASALAVARWLEENGWDDYFLDVSPARGLAPGERWQEALKVAADRCEAVVFLVSPAWRDSRWCLAEFLLAKQLGKTVFAVLIAPTALESLPPEMAAEWQICDLVTGAERHVFRVRHDPVVPETEVAFAAAGLRALRMGLERSGLGPTTFPWPPPSDPTRAPYRGLIPLEAEDAAVFFGREPAIVRGLDVLRGMRERGVERMFVILGASGAGKSSFLRAGLMPRLARDDRRFLPLPAIRPERAALSGVFGLVSSIERALRDLNAGRSRSEIHALLQEPEGFDMLLTELQRRAAARAGVAAAPPTVVMAIDQGEELFGAEGRTEAEHLLSLLARPLARSGGQSAGANPVALRALAIVAIRSDSYERLQIEPKLAGVKSYLFSLPPIARTEFREIIEGPAERSTAAGRKLTVTPALTEQLLLDAEGTDALPLLAFTLERLLIEHGGDGELSLEDYQDLGGVSGSIEAAVQAAFADPGREPTVPADKAERERRLRAGFIPWLARVDPDTEERKRRVAQWIEEIPATARPLLERMINQRLLLRDRRRVAKGDTDTVVVEVAHEALLRQWRPLSAWLAEDAADLKTLDAVKRAAGEWQRNGTGAAWLVHTGERLQAAQALVQRRSDLARLLGPGGRAYLDACHDRDEAARAEREAQLKRISDEQARVAEEQWHTARAQLRTKQLQRYTNLLMGGVAVILTVAAAWTIAQQRDVARQASRVLASEAARASDAGFDDRALRYAVMADRDSWLSPTVPEAEAQLARAARSARTVLRLGGHVGPVWIAEFSPDGRHVVTASEDNTARVWDAVTGAQEVVLLGHEKGIRSAAFSADGQRVVTASWDKTARVWDAATGAQLVVLRGHDSGVRSAAFNADGRRVVTASWDKTARVWDAATGAQVARLEHEGGVATAAFSADGRWLVTASEDQTVRVWDAATGMQVAVFRHGGTVWSAAFSADARQVVSASEDQTARVWDMASKTLVAVLPHEGKVWSAAFSGDGRRIVSASWDHTARVWNAATGAQLAVLRHEGNVWSAAFSSDGQRVVTASDDQTARLWDAATGAQLAVLRGHEKRVRSAAFSPDGQRVVTASFDNTARVWNTATSQHAAVLQGHKQRVRSAAFSPDGRRVVTASDDKTARIWDTATNTQVLMLAGHQGGVAAAAFSADGREVVTASWDGTARVWEAETGAPIAVLRGHQDGVSAAAFSPDGRQVVTASWDKTARLWDAATGREMARLEGHSDGLATAQFSPDGLRVVTAAWHDNTARVWDARTGALTVALRGHEGGIGSAAFSADGQRVVTTSWEDNTARVWDAATGAQVAVMWEHESGLVSAAFSAGAQRVVTASWDGTARVWDAQTGAQMTVLRGHEDVVASAAFSPDGRRVVTASEDNTARVWDVATGMQVAVLQGHGGRLWTAAFSPDGRRVVTASEDKTARVWDVRWLTQYDGRDLVESVCQEKLNGARTLTDQDVSVAPILTGQSGEDVCAQPMLARVWNTVRSLL